MTEIKDVKIIRYDTGDGFKVDIVETASGMEAWLQNEKYAISNLMFGIPLTEGLTRADFLELVDCQVDTYKAIYNENVN